MSPIQCQPQEPNGCLMSAYLTEYLNILVLCQWYSKIHLGSIVGEACSFTKGNLHIQFKLGVPCCVFHFQDVIKEITNLVAF